MTANARTQTISLEYDLPHSPAKVWRGLTEPDLLAQWLMSTDMEPIAARASPSSPIQPLVGRDRAL